MIGSLKPYEDLRETGLPWLGDVPAHWEVRRIKTLLKEIDHRTKSGEERLLSLRMRRGLVDHHDSGGKPIPPDALVGFKVIEPGQIVMNRMRAAYGLFGLADVRGLVSPDYAVFQPASDSYDRYLLETFKLPSLALVFRAESKGLGTGESGFLRLYTDRFGPIPIPYPPLDEQRLIVRFLDWHGAQTAKLVRAKKKIIALLNEQKQAIIHRAVTRGLDPNAKLKPSGIPWLGDVPEGWPIAHLRYLTRCLDGKRVPLNGTQRGAMQGEYPYWGANRIFDHINAWLFDEPLVLLGEDGAPFFDIGKDVAFSVEGKIWVNNHAHILRCGPRITTKFLSHALNCVDYRIFISGSTRDKLTQQAMGSIPIQVPQLSEQQSIIAYLSVATSELVATTNRIQREIALIQEFRTRLIADVVTGKLDVRAAAASLPEVTEIEPIDDLVEGDDLDETVDDAENEEVAA